MSNAPTKFARPVVVISKCLHGARCRYDGEGYRDAFVRALRPYVRYLPVCPEMEIGLGVPRDKIILVQHKNGARLHQPSNGRDLTDEMNRFASRYLDGLGRVDGFLLKLKSPSCGLGMVKLYRTEDPGSRFSRRGVGLFARQVTGRFGYSAIVDEESLASHERRELWLTRLFTLAAFHAALESKRVNSLARFHEHHRLLLQTFGRKGAGNLNRIAAQGMTDFESREEYRRTLYDQLSDKPRKPALLDPLIDAFEYYKRFLKKTDTVRFYDRVDEYGRGSLPLADLRKTVQVWAVRYDKSHIRQDAVYRPYPGPLAEMGSGL